MAHVLAMLTHADRGHIEVATAASLGATVPRDWVTDLVTLDDSLARQLTDEENVVDRDELSVSHRVHLTEGGAECIARVYSDDCLTRHTSLIEAESCTPRLPWRGTRISLRWLAPS